MSGRASAGAAHGFTLVELLITMAVIALIASLAAPAITDLSPTLRLRADAEALRGEFRAARADAIRSAAETTVEINLEDRRLVRSAERERLLPDGVEIRLTAARRERTEHGAARVRFFPDGTSTGGALTLRSETTTATLTVDWFDGSTTLRYEGAE